jgi:serine/threonine-protein kinase
MLRPGVLLGNRYRLDERIAGGGMGDVWRGTDEVLGRTVAVKILLPALLDEPGFAERFRGEARTMATINHPGVVDVYDYGSDEQVAFLVMEYVEGDALSRTLHRVKRLTPARTMALMAQAADALQAAHEKGIVHRDVKPGNLLVRPNGTLVLTDFGIARSELVGQLTAAGSVLGTASYISPEQAAGATATSASDVYALGVVAYQCLSGHRPFEGDNPLEVAMRHVREVPRPLPGDIPPAVRSIVERSMAKDPAARWPSASAMAAVARQAAALAAGHHPASGPLQTRPGSVPPAPPTSGGVTSVPPAPGSPAMGPPTAGPRPPAGPMMPGGTRSMPMPHGPTSGPGGPVPSTRPMPHGPSPGPGGPVSSTRPGPPPGYRGPAVQPPRPVERPYGGYGSPAAYGRPPPASQPAPERNRNGLITVVVVVGLLALLACAGLIGYLAQGA